MDGTAHLKARNLAGVLTVLIAFALSGYATIYLSPKLLALLPRSGRVIEFKITEASDNGPERASFISADVSPDMATLDDFAATAVAIASVVPGDRVIVSVERSDIAPSVDRWRRALARAEHRRKDKATWYVSTAEPLLSAKEIAASVEYSARAGLALTNENQPLSPEADAELVKITAAKYGVTADRVTMIASLHKETGDRADWRTLPGPGSQHVDDLARCYAGKARGTDAWKDCR